MSLGGRIGVAVVSVAAITVLVGSGALASSNAVKVRVTPSSVDAGGAIFVSAGVKPARVRCTATINRGAKRLKAFAAKQATTGTVRWRWVVPRSAPTGSLLARVVCPGAGKGSARVSVRALPPPVPPTIPAKVVVVKSGIASRLSSIGSTFSGYGIQLQNLSPDEDALSVEVVVNILDASGLILKSESDIYTGIPAGATYYAGGEAIISQGTPSRLEISVKVGGRQKKSIPGLPAPLPGPALTV